MTDKHENWTRDYAISTVDDKEKLPILDEHGYSAIFEFQQKFREQMVLEIKLYFLYNCQHLRGKSFTRAPRFVGIFL